jgi:hypothetical protein
MRNLSRTTLTVGLTLGTLAAGTAGALTVTAAAGSDSAGAAGPEHQQSIVLDMPFTGGHSHYIDNGRKGVSAGDEFLSVGQPILAHGTNHRIGSSDAVELIVSGRHDGTVTAQGTLRLRGGHVQLDGIVRHTDDPLQVPVVGGTGAYAGAGGQLTLLREDVKHKVSISRLDLVLP